MQRISVIDSHTAGEPTRVVIDGMPDLGPGDAAARREVFAARHDDFRRAVVNEPRGSDVLVGALLLPPSIPDCIAATVFFNNVGCLGMCGHGAIGLVATLAHLGRIGPGTCRIETPAGIVSATLHGDGNVSLVNVPSFRKAKDLAFDVPGIGIVRGDVAWGGNWFFLVTDPDGTGGTLNVSRASALLELCTRIRQVVNANGYPEVDHVELFSPPHDPANHSRNFVLCPGGAYDRSPCGTGTSAKLACLAADGKLAPGAIWRQESVVGSVFTGTVATIGGAWVPTISSRAWVTSEATLLLAADDPFRTGIASAH